MTTPYFFHPQAAPWLKIGPASLMLTLFSHKETALEHVWLRHAPDNEEALVPMRRCGTHGVLTVWQVELPLNREQELMRYLFKIVSDEQQWWLHAAGISPRMPTKDEHFRYNPRSKPPLWVQDQIFYQIFPDRFSNGEPGLSVKAGEYSCGPARHPARTQAWGALPAQDDAAGCEFYGGDLPGIQQHLYYLQSLGITALYLNPIFAAPSNHRYDTLDYYRVDPHLGSNDQLAELVANLHQRSMRIVLDVAVGHTSDRHAWFDRDGGQGACGNPDSPYRSYYSFDKQGFVLGWKGQSHLPKLDFAAAGVQEAVYGGDDAILRHWLRAPYQIDGWRLDGIHMLGEGGSASENARHVRAIRQAVKQENPDAYLLGEHRFQANDWLQGEQEDGAMNYYGFAHPVRAYLAGKDIAGHPIHITARELDQWLQQSRAAIPFANQLAQFNLLDSHDTPRFLTLLEGDLAGMQAAVTLLFTYVGVPCLFYGDEIGLEGGDEPDCRRAFPWESTEWNHLLHDHYRRMIRLRRIHPALRRGDIHTLYAGEHSFVFARTLESDVVITAVNRHPTKARTMTLPIWQTGSLASRFTDPETRDKFEVVKGEIQLTLPPKTARVLLAS